MTKQITKLSDKLTKCSDSMTVNIYDNGYMIEISGRDSKEDWKTAKIMCTTLMQVHDIIKEAAEMDRET